MTNDYLIIGGGMVADAAAKGIRERDADGTIGILGEESTPPFPPRPAGTLAWRVLAAHAVPEAFDDLI